MLPKENRLLKRPDFLRCYNSGKRYFTPRFIVFVLPTENGLRFGVAVSKKVGGAVQRNRIKRLLREFFRLNRNKMPFCADVVVVPKKGIDPAQLKLQHVEADLLSLITGMKGKKS